jgi:hypothetical protein
MNGWADVLFWLALIGLVSAIFAWGSRWFLPPLCEHEWVHGQDEDGYKTRSCMRCGYAERVE